MAEAVKKPNIFVRIGRGIKRFFKEFRSEVKKISWPTWKQTLNNTLIVIAMVALVGLIVWILDFVFAAGLQLVVNLFL